MSAESGKDWRERNPGRQAIVSALWREKNRDKVELYQTRHKAKMKLQAEQARARRAAERALLPPWELPGWCSDCCVVHTHEQRLRTLRRLLPLTAHEILELQPCLWKGIAGNRKLYRDLHNLGAERESGTGDERHWGSGIWGFASERRRAIS